jgi:hypothetical protein
MSPAVRYITGYILRFVLGTALVLCVIAAVRITKFSDELERPVQPDKGDGLTWENLLVYPDMLVNSALEKFAPQYLPLKSSADEQGDAIPGGSRVASQDEPAVGAADNLVGQPAQEGSDVSSGSTEAGAGASEQAKVVPAAPAEPIIDIPYSGEWGITADASVPVYSLKGKKLGSIPSGNIFVVLERKHTARGEFLKCAFLRRKDKTVILKPEDAILYKCDINATSREQRALCVRQAKLLGAIASRENELREKAQNKNPYAAEYKKSKRKYTEMAKKSNSYLKEYNNSTGAKRMEYADKLRLIKDEALRVKRDYKAIKTKYLNWKSSHTATDYNFRQDSKIKQLRKELAAVEHKLANS